MSRFPIKDFISGSTFFFFVLSGFVPVVAGYFYFPTLHSGALTSFLSIAPTSSNRHFSHDQVDASMLLEKHHSSLISFAINSRPSLHSHTFPTIILSLKIPHHQHHSSRKHKLPEKCAFNNPLTQSTRRHLSLFKLHSTRIPSRMGPFISTLLHS